RNPELNAATSEPAALVDTGAELIQGPPPGILLPEYNVAARSLVSIQATPATTLVCTVSGRRYASYTAGNPCTSRPAGCHWPSPATGGLAMGAIGVGGVRCSGTTARGGGGGWRVDELGNGIAPLAGLPPTGGG